MIAQDGREACDACHIIFGETEERFRYLNEAYHSACVVRHKERRAELLKKFLRSDRGQVTLHVEPHRLKGGRFDPG